MQQILAQVYTYLVGVWRYRWLALGIAWTLSVAGWLWVWSLPSSYLATARLDVDSTSILRPLLRGLAIQPDVNQRVALMSKTLLNRPNLEKLMRMADLDLHVKSDLEEERLLTSIKEAISLRGDSQNASLYSVSFKHEDRDTAKRVVQSLMTIFIESTLGEKRKDSSGAQAFLDQQIADYELRLSEAEQRLANFKQRNVGMLPGEAGGYYQRLDMARSQLSTAQLQLRELENRRNELMVRMRGYEEVAQAMGYVGVFLTLTCPSKYHAYEVSGRSNPRYCKEERFSPRDAQDYLNSVWQSIRAKWDRQGVKCFGFRVAEPHHDGTPHWHLMLFMHPDVVSKASAIFTDYALRVDGDELGAEQNRCDVKVIDPEKGTAAGYIAKYVAKNIDGFEVGPDFEAGALSDAQLTAARVKAWASTWGIRQFQQIGSVSVSVYRELRRLAQEEVLDDEVMPAIWAAADSADWAQFVELMGGALVTREGQALRLLKVLSDEENEYGEWFEKIRGVVLRGVNREMRTRLHTWAISRVEVIGNVYQGEGHCRSGP